MDDAMTNRLKTLVISSNEALELKLVREVADLEDESTTFKAEMSHQVFGDSETIFGFRDLRVKLYYSACSLETYLGMSYSERISKNAYEGVEADEVLPKVREWLATPHVHDNLDSFITSLSKDDDFKPCGELVHSVTIHDEDGEPRQFEVYKADMTHKGYKEYHQRLQTFVIWYIDAANYINVDDDQWHYFNMYEKYTTSSGNVRYGTIGFSTVYQYYAYPALVRPRIAQILILPPFQTFGLGAHLLRAIYREYVTKSEVKDITVEDPTASFQRVRDYVDALNCSTLPSYSRENLLKGYDKTMMEEARDKFKINKRQSRRVYEILRLSLTDVSNENDYREYRLDVKKRLNVPYKRERHNLKKLEVAMLQAEKGTNVPLPTPEQRMQALDNEYRQLEEDYKKVIKRLEENSEQ